MKLKQIPEDFIVEEIYDLKKFEEKEENRKQPYYYFKLTKTNYNQLRALEVVANTFNTSKKLVHFAGTKDKVGITSQIVSVYGISEDNFEKNLEYFNENIDDLKLEFIGKYNGRINLGDNLGNHFKIIVRDLNEKDIVLGKEQIEFISKNGILNFFDSQRFGYANNSHIVGKYILQNNVELTVKEIMTSLPNESTSEILPKFVNFIKENWENIKNQDEKIIEEAKELCPNYLRAESQMLDHLKKHKNDYPGAFRKIHKKLRTLYVNAYQSYIFNEIVKNLHNENLLEKYEELELISYDTNYNEFLEKKVQFLLEKDNLTKDSFKLPSMPELKIKNISRKTRIFPRNLELIKTQDDDLFENKKKAIISFDLDSGEYATNVIKQIFE